MTKVTVFARDNDKPGNREVVAFLRQHLPQLVQAGLRFTFSVADGKEKELVARGIDKLPAIEVQTTQGPKCFLTPVEIKSALLKYLASKGVAVGGAAVRAPRKAEDDLQDYYAREMNMDKYEEDLENGDDNGSSKKDIMARVQEEMERRESENKKRGPPQPKRGRRRAGNVRDDEDEPRATSPPRRARRDDDDEPRRSREPTRPKTPQDRVREVGGDPGNKDDAMLMAMMETSDE
jgi:hypothetical protein